MWRPTPYADAVPMPTPSDPPLPVTDHGPIPDETTLAGLNVEGSLPTALNGRHLQIDPHGMVHAVEIYAALTVAYRTRRVVTDAVATNIMAFGGRTLALGPGAVAYELDEDLGTVGRIDLAGHGRGIGAHPQLDPHTGALHLVSYGDEPAHHIVAPNSQTRFTVPVPDAPGPLEDLLVTRDHVVLLGDTFLGVVDRAGPATPRWVDVALTDPVAAHDVDDRVTVLTARHSLVRWTFDDGAHRRDVVDDTPQRFGTTNPRASDPVHVWTVATGGTEVYRHDLRTGARTAHDLGAGRRQGAMTFVPDPDRLDREDGGWLLVVVHHDARDQADLVVLDAAALHRPPVATALIPRAIPHGLHGTWIPAP